MRAQALRRLPVWAHGRPCAEHGTDTASLTGQLPKSGDRGDEDAIDRGQSGRCPQFLRRRLWAGGADPTRASDHLWTDCPLAWTSQRRQSRRLCAACPAQRLGDSVATGDQCGRTRQLALRPALRGDPARLAGSRRGKVRLLRERRSSEVRLERASSEWIIARTAMPEMTRASAPMPPPEHIDWNLEVAVGDGAGHRQHSDSKAHRQKGPVISAHAGL
jgi:hypothetical protein